MEAELAIGTIPIGLPAPSKPSLLKRFLLHLHDHVVPHARNNYVPHVLHHRTLALVSVLLLSAKVASIALIAISPAPLALSAEITQINVTSLTNQSRIAGGLQALTTNSKLTQAAQAKAEALLACQTFAHNLPAECSGNRTTPWDFVKGFGYQYVMAGENLAVNFVDDADMHQAWMNSPGHRANIMNENFKEIGIGIIIGQFQGGTSTIVVQMFGTPAVQNVKLSEKPTPVAEQPKTVASETSQAKVTQVVPPKKGLQPRQAEAAPLALAPTQPDQALNNESQAQASVITNSELSRVDQSVHIKVTTEGPISRVIASYGQEAIQLSPTSETSWEGDLSLSKLTQGNRSIQVQAYNPAGAVTGTKIASFSDDIFKNFASAPQESGKKANFFGRIVDLGELNHKFYLLSVAGILSAMIMAILIRRHIQHVHMIANGSFVVIIAMLMWWSGL